MIQSEDRHGSSNELILNPGSQAFLQDNTKGNVVTHVGPMVITQTGTLRPIKFIDGRFEDVSLQDAAVSCVLVHKGEYLELHNPTVEENGLKHPTPATNNTSVPQLRHGEKIVVPGPVEFALWPQQDVTKIGGHRLRPDQYLLVRVYDESAAVDNWSSAIVTVDDGTDTVASKTATELGLTLGQLLVIQDVSFYIPPTGVEVVPDDNGEYVRNALTLEMNEYAILVDQGGEKRYPQGPQTVFPTSTEEFFSDAKDNIKFRPIELAVKQGLHIKINCDYTAKWPGDVDNPVAGIRDFKAGEEVFITGETHPIYYPCEEHSIVGYGDNLVHFATAVPAGQARYVMNKSTGATETRMGPDMILLNPIHEVFVTRILSDAESELMYPGNQDSLAYNRSLRSFKADHGLEELTSSSIHMMAANTAVADKFESVAMTRGISAAPAALPDVMHRKTSYTKPHSVTLDDRFAGAPTLNIWTGFAVLLTKANGSQRVEIGPQVAVLDYDETLAPFHLSTSKPKTTDELLTTGYLEIGNNKVSDIIAVETSDGVHVQLKVSYRVSFTGESIKFFAVDNYVKFLCDHARSRLKGTARSHSIREFYRNTVGIVRDTILGAKVDGEPRTGLLFDENGMHVTDVELLSVEIADSDIALLLTQQQAEVITNQIEIDRETQHLEVTRAQQSVKVETLQLEDKTRQIRHALNIRALEDTSDVDEFMAEQEVLRGQERIVGSKQAQDAENVAHTASLSRRQENADLDMKTEEASTAQVVARFKAAEGDLAAAIRELSDKQVITTLAEAVGPMSLIGDIDLSTIVAGLIGSAGQKSKLFERLTTLVDSNDSD